jgi:hypothetical protein
MSCSQHMPGRTPGLPLQNTLRATGKQGEHRAEPCGTEMSFSNLNMRHASLFCQVVMSQPVKVGPRCPEDTPFKQQRLPAWQPILTPNWVIGTFFIVAAIFMPIGGAIYAASSSVTEIRVNYGELCKQAPPTTTTAQFVVSKDLKNPLVYYELSNFYQNHRRYVTSRSDSQLRAAEDALGTSDFITVAKSAALSTCTPLVCAGNAGDNGCGTSAASYLANGRNNLIYYPCGLIARSMFNDTFTNLRNVDSATLVNLNKQKIAWPSDIDKKFLSPNAERLKPDGTSGQSTSQGFISKHCGGFGDFCTNQDAAHPSDGVIAQKACDLSGWCNTPINPSNPNGPKFTVAILRTILYGTPSPGDLCGQPLSPPALLRPNEQIYNCWHRCVEAQLFT